uniref:Uncharacterized protein n=1 Tax=Meloidogyne enterolobii TaxID=390850 RepID=A0A6V7TR72_MELEN|nr:unnamed protein product [Meloidogyne enterolobii]
MEENKNDKKPPEVEEKEEETDENEVNEKEAKNNLKTEEENPLEENDENGLGPDNGGRKNPNKLEEEENEDEQLNNKKGGKKQNKDEEATTKSGNEDTPTDKTKGLDELQPSENKKGDDFAKMDENGSKLTDQEENDKTDSGPPTSSKQEEKEEEKSKIPEEDQQIQTTTESPLPTETQSTTPPPIPIPPPMPAIPEILNTTTPAPNTPPSTESVGEEDRPNDCSSDPGQWSEWKETGLCTAECGACGLIQRTRECLSYKDGKGCPCLGEYKVTEPCNIGVCPYPKPSCCMPYSLIYVEGNFACGPMNEDLTKRFLDELKSNKSGTSTRPRPKLKERVNQQLFFRR